MSDTETAASRGVNRKAFAFAVTLFLVALVAWAGSMSSGKRLVQEPSDFAAAVDMGTIDAIAVHPDGRIKSFASFANGMMDFVTGPRTFEGQSPSFTFLDLIFRPQRYEDAAICYVKHKGLREEIIDAAEASDLADSRSPTAMRDFDARVEFLRKWGLVSPRILEHPKVAARLHDLSQDVIRWSKFVDQVEDSLAVRSAMVLFQQLRVVPPPGGDEFDAWGTIADLRMGSGVAKAMTAEQSQGLLDRWNALGDAWKSEDVEGVQEAARALSDELAAVNPAVYPPRDRLEWESWYFRHGSLNWIWMVYLVSFVFLLLALVYGWRFARGTGLAVFLVAFAMQTAALGLRWWVSGRWPNSNMFEAVTTSAWFGGCAAVAFWIFGRSVLMRHLCILTSAASSMVALMCAAFMPLQLNPNISNMMPVLHDVWLYIHTNVIIASYILIFMAAVSALLYLLWRACGGPASHVSIAGVSLMSRLSRGELKAVATGALPADGRVLDSSHEDELAQVTSGRIDMGVILDGVTMLLMKLSFVMLWAGIVMGAIWADHSWGRPWGWDPKEVFALNTFLVFAVLVHVRWKVRDKGLWTAWLAVFGAGVMMFNWIVINFLITGLHSYA